jgi:hypothetical protein
LIPVFSFSFFLLGLSIVPQLKQRNPVQNSNSDYIPIIKLHPDFCCVYNEYVGNHKRVKSSFSIKNLEQNKHGGELSKKAIRRLYTALDWLLVLAKEKTADKLKTKGTFRYKLAMLTLTLPSQQAHSDLYIKKYLLNDFLTNLRKKYNLQNYIWKGEKQDNGNIHFHLILDKYIFYKEINTMWNSILNKHGYIDEYRKNQQTKHNDGFYYDKKNSNRWSKSAQLSAYKKGIATNWCQPTSTTDIHSLKKIRNAKAYLGKYITKNPDVEKEVGRKIEECKKESGAKSITQWQYEDIKSEVRKKLSVEGNLWYISQSLSKLKGAVEVIGNKIGNELRWFEKNFADRVIYKDFCSIYKFSLKDIFKLKLNNIGDLLKTYILNLRSIFYPPGESIGSPLGIPLNIFE